MKKTIFGALGALALCVSTLQAAAAPAVDAPLQTAIYRADLTEAHLQTVQYRREFRGPPRRFYRPHRHYDRPRGYRGHRGFYRGPRPGYGRY